MFMRLMICAVLLCLTVMPVAAEIDPQSLVGVWEGSYEIRGHGGKPWSGSITLTISKEQRGGDGPREAAASSSPRPEEAVERDCPLAGKRNGTYPVRDDGDERSANSG